LVFRSKKESPIGQKTITLGKRLLKVRIVGSKVKPSKRSVKKQKARVVNLRKKRLKTLRQRGVEKEKGGSQRRREAKL